jgi:hypothetical protein
VLRSILTFCSTAKPRVPNTAPFDGTPCGTLTQYHLRICNLRLRRYLMAGFAAARADHEDSMEKKVIYQQRAMLPLLMVLPLRSANLYVSRCSKGRLRGTDRGGKKHSYINGCVFVDDARWSKFSSSVVPAQEQGVARTEIPFWTGESNQDGDALSSFWIMGHFWGA